MTAAAFAPSPPPAPASSPAAASETTLPRRGPSKGAVLSKMISTLELGSRVEVDMASPRWRDMYGGAVQLQVSDGRGPAITVTLDGGDTRELLAALTRALKASEDDYQAALARSRRLRRDG